MQKRSSSASLVSMCCIRHCTDCIISNPSICRVSSVSAAKPNWVDAQLAGLTLPAIMSLRHAESASCSQTKSLMPVTTSTHLFVEEGFRLIP